MANRINVKLILELRSGGMSQNEIARTRHMSKTSVSTVVNIAKEKAISFEDIRDLVRAQLIQPIRAQLN
jgi:transcriptional regulator